MHKPTYYEFALHMLLQQMQAWREHAPLIHPVAHELCKKLESEMAQFRSMKLPMKKRQVYDYISWFLTPRNRLLYPGLVDGNAYLAVEIMLKQNQSPVELLDRFSEIEITEAWAGYLWDTWALQAKQALHDFHKG